MDSRQPALSSGSIKSVLFYGHGVTLACFAVMFLLYGSVLNTFTVFFNPIVEDLGWSNTALSVAMAVGAVAMGISAPFAGRFMDRIGTKPVMIAGAIMIGVGILAASRIMYPWQIYILYSLVGCGLACATVIPCSLIISNWFVSKRGMAMGIMAMGTSVGGMLMSPVANWIILHYGWRSAYIFSGVIILTVALPIIIFLLRTRPSDVGLEPYVDATQPPGDSDAVWGLNVKEASGTIAFWQIAFLMFIIGIVTSGIGAHIVPCLVKDFGYSQTGSTNVWAYTLAVMTFAKFAFGPIADRWGPKNAMAASCLLMAIAIWDLSNAFSYEIAIMFAVVYGFGVGAPLTVNPLLVAQTLGVKHFGAIYGILNLISIVGAAIGPVALGIVSDARTSYLSALYAFIGLMAVTAVVSYFIKPTVQKANSVSSVEADVAVDQ